MRIRRRRRHRDHLRGHHRCRRRHHRARYSCILPRAWPRRVPLRPLKPAAENFFITLA